MLTLLLTDDGDGAKLAALGWPLGGGDDAPPDAAPVATLWPALQAGVASPGRAGAPVDTAARRRIVVTHVRVLSGGARASLVATAATTLRVWSGDTDGRPPLTSLSPGSLPARPPPPGFVLDGDAARALAAEVAADTGAPPAAAAAAVVQAKGLLARRPPVNGGAGLSSVTRAELKEKAAALLLGRGGVVRE